MREPVMGWITHYSHQLWASVLLFQGGLTAIDVFLDVPWHVWMAGNLCMLALAVLDRRLHNPVQCLRCLPEQQRGAELSLEWRQSLQIHHWVRLRGTTILLSLAALTGLYFLAQFIGESLIAAVMRLAVAAGCGLLAATSVVASRHQRARQWCPWCRRGDEGDDDETVPPPVPAATATRV